MVRAQLPCDDVAREVVEHRRQIHPSPSDDLEVGKVGLPHLVGARGFGVELIRGLDHHIGRAGDEIMGLEQAVNRGFRHEVALLVGEAHRQFTRGQLRLFQRHLDDLVMDVCRDAVPHPARAQMADRPALLGRLQGSDHTSGRMSGGRCPAGRACALRAGATARQC